MLYIVQEGTVHSPTEKCVFCFALIFEKKTQWIAKCKWWKNHASLSHNVHVHVSMIQNHISIVICGASIFSINRAGIKTEWDKNSIKGLTEYYSNMPLLSAPIKGRPQCYTFHCNTMSSGTWTTHLKRYVGFEVV